MKAVQAAFVAALGEIRNPAFDRVNTAFGKGGFQYASLASFVEAAREALTRHKLALVQPIFPIGLCSRCMTGDGHYLEIQTRVLHESGEILELGRFPFMPDASKPQSVGATLTYFRRYALAAALGIVADEDQDGNDAVTKRKPQPKVETLPPAADVPLGLALASELKAKLRDRDLALEDLHKALVGEGLLGVRGVPLSLDPAEWPTGHRRRIGEWMRDNAKPPKVEPS
jgi:hypothetical protein